MHDRVRLKTTPFLKPIYRDRVLTLSDSEADCIPCEICNALISLSELEDHQIQCRIASEQSMHDEYEEMFHQAAQKRSKVSDMTRSKSQTKSPMKAAPARVKKPDVIIIDDGKNIIFRRSLIV